MLADYHFVRWVSIFVLFTQCSPKNSSAEFFTGEIEYTYHYKSDSLNIDSLKALKPHKSIFRFDSLNYQSQFFGKDTTTYFYLSKSNLGVGQTTSTDSLECEDYGVATDSILYFKIYPSDTLVLGQECMVLEYQGKYFWNRYYVSAQSFLAPQTYQNHRAYNWQFYGEKSRGGLILKLEHRFEKYTMVGEAARITPFTKGELAIQASEERLLQLCR
jgi:hypothetical protein